MPERVATADHFSQRPCVNGAFAFALESTRYVDHDSVLREAARAGIDVVGGAQVAVDGPIGGTVAGDTKARSRKPTQSAC